MSFLEDLRWRGLLHDHSEGVAEALAGAEPVSGYIGFDPTASSLHVGSLVPIMGLVRLQRAGHRPVCVVGGGTGLIGDPSGKASERALLSREDVEENVRGIRRQLEAFLDFAPDGKSADGLGARMVNNLDWLGEYRFLDFLREVGKHFSVNVLLKKEAVRRRLESDEGGVSFTEFSYVLLQAYDFLELYRRHGVALQMGGSDQWGNIVAGIDLIRRVEAGKGHGVTFPLVTTSSGVKFGKTEAGTIWLDPARTSPYRFYQFWLNAEDADASRYLRYFTLLERERIEELDALLAAHPERREAQRALAEDVTLRVHGESGLARARRASEVLFGGSVEGLERGEIEDIFADVPSSSVLRSRLEGEGVPLVELLAEATLAPSRGEARRAIEGGGIYVNNRRAEGAQLSVTTADLLEGAFLLLRKGKRQYHLLRVVG
jgi:tyrosyl-tRNA synthetase